MDHLIPEVWDHIPDDTIYAVPKANLTGREAEKAFHAHKWSPRIAASRPLSVYVHVPFCTSLCQFCGFVTSGKFSNADLDVFERNVIRELSLAKDEIDCGGRKLGAVFFGGGTASVLQPNAVANILDHIKASFEFLDNAELTFEGECQTLKRPGYIDAIAQLGFQRLSFGVQTMDSDIRALVNLVPSVDLMANLCKSAKERFDEVSVDFIFGWPAQTPDHAKGDLIELIETLDPDGIEIFRFEGQDAAPALMKLFASLNCAIPSGLKFFDTQQVIHETLLQYGYSRVSYTKYSRVQHAYAGGYGPCYYGWNDGEVLGIGRGAQSFIDGAMYGTAHPPALYNALIESGRLPIADFAVYEPGWRENVTWPRRGWIERDVIRAEFRPVIDAMQQAGLVASQGSRVVATSAGNLRVPRLLEALWQSIAPERPVQELAG